MASLNSKENGANYAEPEAVHDIGGETDPNVGTFKCMFTLELFTKTTEDDDFLMIEEYVLMWCSFWNNSGDHVRVKIYGLDKRDELVKFAKDAGVRHNGKNYFTGSFSISSNGVPAIRVNKPEFELVVGAFLASEDWARSYDHHLPRGEGMGV